MTKCHCFCPSSSTDKLYATSDWFCDGKLHTYNFYIYQVDAAIDLDTILSVKTSCFVRLNRGIPFYWGPSGSKYLCTALGCKTRSYIHQRKMTQCTYTSSAVKKPSQNTSISGAPTKNFISRGTLVTRIEYHLAFGHWTISTPALVGLSIQPGRKVRHGVRFSGA